MAVSIWTGPRRSPDVAKFAVCEGVEHRRRAAEHGEATLARLTEYLEAHHDRDKPGGLQP